VIPGDRDPVLLPRASEHIASVVPGAVLAELAPAKHMGLMERHADFNATVERFVEAQALVRVIA
jgi:pimeloyl-ACP methyl ester carboxylesterase